MLFVGKVLNQRLANLNGTDASGFNHIVDDASRTLCSVLLPHRLRAQIQASY